MLPSSILPFQIFATTVESSGKLCTLVLVRLLLNSCKFYNYWGTSPGHISLRTLESLVVRMAWNRFILNFLRKMDVIIIIIIKLEGPAWSIRILFISMIARWQRCTCLILVRWLRCNCLIHSNLCWPSLLPIFIQRVILRPLHLLLGLANGGGC